MIKIQKAHEEDAAALKALLYTTWSEAYKIILTTEEIKKVTTEWHSIHLLKRQINDPDNLFLVAKDKGVIIGLCNTDITEPTHLNIQRLHVLPGYQHKGVGTKLLEATMNTFPDCEGVDLEVDEENYPAINFYEKRGFKKSGKKVFTVASVKLHCFVMKKKLQ